MQHSNRRLFRNGGVGQGWACPLGNREARGLSCPRKLPVTPHGQQNQLLRTRSTDQISHKRNLSEIHILRMRKPRLGGGCDSSQMTKPVRARGTGF